MTPSGWQEERRDAGHDVLQLSVAKWIKNRPRGDKKLISVSVEVPLVVEDRFKKTHLAGFVDVLEIVEATDEGKEIRIAYLWEIKPKIWSVGGLIRQVQATGLLFWKSTIMDYATTKQFQAMGCCIAYPESDPKAKEMEDHLSFLWKGKHQTIINARPWNLETGAPAHE